MKIYQTLKPGRFAIILILVMTAMFTFVAFSGEFSLITPQLIIFMIEIAAMMCGILFARNHLSYCAPETQGYKYFRSIPNFEKQFRKQCIVSDVVCYGIGFAVTILNITVMTDNSLYALLGIAYLFVVTMTSFISAFVNTSHRLFIYTIMFSTIPASVSFVVLITANDMPKDFIQINVQLIILVCFTVFAVISEILFYKRLGNNLKTSYGKG